jgi:hypothetical protein
VHILPVSAEVGVDIAQVVQTLEAENPGEVDVE